MRVDRNFEPIQTERLVLRRSRLDDAATIAAYRSNPEVSRYQGWDRTDLEGVREAIAEMADRAPGEQDWVQFTVEERDGGALVGDVGLSPVEGEPGVIKVGYTMAPSAQGKGYATEAVRALVDYAFERSAPTWSARTRARRTSRRIASPRRPDCAWSNSSRVAKTTEPRGGACATSSAGTSGRPPEHLGVLERSHFSVRPRRGRFRFTCRSELGSIGRSRVISPRPMEAQT